MAILRGLGSRTWVRRCLGWVTVLCLLGSLVSAVPVSAAAEPAVSCGPNSTSSHGGVCTITPIDANNLRIDQPFVAGGFYEYQSILFEPGDLITLNAGGCVQTGGAGATWKRYVNPSGPNSDRLYNGTVTIPGAVFFDRPDQPVSGTPFSSFALGDKHSFYIPLDTPANIPQHLDLRLGYNDDQYDDNGYYDHDDGTDNQCALDHDGGPAWVTVSVQHGVTGPWPATNPRPFDLVRSGFDSNLLFSNPAWGWQVNGGSVATDGSYFNCVVNLSPCHSQITSIDHIGFDVWGALGGIVGHGLCGEDAFTGANAKGHENWFDATYNGHIEFEEWSGSTFGDDDYNMLLTPDDYGGSGPRGVTSDNPANIRIEFDSDETIDNFDSEPWFGNFHYDVSNPTQANFADLDRMLKDHDAVVTGLMGLDTEHNNTSELHPVHVLAIRESAPGSIDPAHDTWAIFARNWGDEGECGSQQHFLDSTSVTVDLPHPGNVAATALGVPIGDNTFHVHGTNQGPAIHPIPGSTQVTFDLPAGADKPFAVGEVQLNWTGTPVAAQPTMPRHARAAATTKPPTGPVRQADSGGDGDAESILAAIGQGMTPAQLQTASTLFEQLRAHTRLDSTPVAATLSNTPPPVPAGVPTVSTGPDPISLQRIHAQFQALCSATGGSLPTQPDWCTALNQPPATMLSYTGGTPGPDGWLTTPVTVTLTPLDASGSGIDHTEYSYDGQHWGLYTEPTTLPDGIYTFYYRSQDNKGNLEEARQRAFKIDTAPPVITVNQPTATPYTHSSALTLDYTVTDGPASGVGAGSGVASVQATMDGSSTLAGHGLQSGQAINLLTELPLGTHSFTINAVDNVGHAASATVAVSIIATPESIEDDVHQFVASGDIRNHGIEQSLLAKLDAAANAWESGRCDTAANIYDAFISELQAQSGNAVTPTAAQIMIGDAQYLVDHSCGQPGAKALAFLIER